VGNIKGTTKGNQFFFDADDPRLVVVTDPAHKLYDRRVELPIDDSMVETIAKHGVIQPIIVRKVGDSYEVTAGRRRVLHSREAQKRYPEKKIRIPVITRTINDYESAVFATIENVQRVDDSPAVRGTNAKRMMELGASQDELCSMFGVEWRTIQLWIRVSENATEPVQDALSAGRITLTSALMISRKPKDRQGKALEAALSKGLRKPGPKKGEPRRRKIRIVATELDAGGFSIDVSKCTETELAAVIEELDEELNRRKTA
jgi:ParB family chromosome partitioning protein